MKSKITIIDYGMGNLYSVVNALKNLGAEPVVTSDAQEIRRAEKILLPGVGAFGDCMSNLEKSGLIPVIKEALNSGKPFLGICLGMQVLFEGSEEDPGVKGLGYFKGQVKKIQTDLKIPHMGWNSLELKTVSPLLKDADGKYVYFVHSYFCDSEDKSIITAVTDYGTEVTASVGKGSVQAFQFHPEKSSKVGLALLRAFKEWQP
ncbi:MAG: imidazole glycerol phosphate synthase subunit HisH [Phascolarctobacterium sp.]|nr:imidazole glycerol phosphate synthase subunit HisH [Phascolarctobacterium sp.]